MAKQTVYLGGAPNDGTGDSIRASFTKLNENFDEIYVVIQTFDTSSKNASFANTALFGNSTVNSYINSVAFSLANSTHAITIASGIVSIGNSTVNTIANSSLIRVGANVSANQLALRITGAVGNSTVNSTIVQVQNSSSVANLTASSLTIGSGIFSQTIIQTQSANVSTNTFTLGTSNVSANGFTRLPNGLLYQWGAVSSNSSIGNITFPTGFSSLLSISVTPSVGTYDTTHIPMLIASNTTTANVRTGNTTNVNVFFTAIGT